MQKANATILTNNGCVLFLFTQRCTLSFHPTSSSNEGSYAVQVEMEDFSNQSVSRVPSDAFSKIPIRFALMGRLSLTVSMP